MAETLEKLLGPRTPAELMAQHRWRYRLPTLFMGLAGFCLLVSIFLPYWRMTLLAPQYPGGLHVHVYVNRLSGDVREIDLLNHYIGMRPLGEAAQLERSLSIFAIAVLALLLVATVYVHNQFAALLSLPAMLFPAIFLADLAFWLRNYGQNLDPRAPLSSAIKPFVPPLLGEGRVGQFRTVAALDTGFYLAALAALLILVGLYCHRRAYKPLVEAQLAQERE
ncbi:MAG: hypothetical protein KatS3mg131_2751 [Candidatus Tectimicrobiota bacterium]|nr:MAG: hypothetical protein KatS3mg131_2751 [Candidatus Tectomicrobia bacterium]